MTFASVEFLCFFPVVIGLLLLIQRVLPLSEQRRQTAGHVVLLIASYIFYGWWDARFCTLLMGITLIAFYSAAPRDEKRPGASRAALLVGVGTPLLVLGVFKYYDFFVDSFCQAFHINNGAALQLILPVGISFYTFQSLSYTIDVYTGRIEKEQSFLRFALYISFFPQLVAGPIVKAADFLPQLAQQRRVTLRRLEEGVQIFAFGMFKKLVLADNLSLFVDEVYRTPDIFHSGTVLLAVVSYGIQIYMDFSGYSDMAIGCARCLGYDLNKNFDLPYLSRNVSEFWKRWHISLSSWLQQYLYIPLGGNRKGTVRTYVNLMATMLLGGLWHGANWTFVVWGGLHGAALCVHKCFLRFTRARKNAPSDRGRKADPSGNGKTGRRLGTLCAILLTDAFVLFCWIFFRAESMGQAAAVIRRLLGFYDGVVHVYSWSIVAILLVAAAMIAAQIRSRRRGETVQGFYPLLPLDRYWGLVLFFLEIGLILGLAYVQGNPFIYFQF